MIGIIGAMDQELSKFMEFIEEKQEISKNHFDFIVGKIKNKDIVVVKAGIGKVASSVACAMLLQSFDIEYVINLGSAGGVKPLQIGDIVVADKLFYGDVDLTAFSYPYGQMSGCPAYFQSEPSLVDRFIHHNPLQSIDRGSVLTLDTFMVDDQRTTALIQSYFANDHIFAVEMEATAIAQTCFIFKKPVLIIKAISDVIGSDDQAGDFDHFIKKISDKLAQILYNIF